MNKRQKDGKTKEKDVCEENFEEKIGITAEAEIGVL